MSAEASAPAGTLDADDPTRPTASLWGEVVGQPDVVATLQVAVDSPVHAWLLVGPEGSGKRAAAMAFAAELLGRGLDDAGRQRAARLVASGTHPSLVVVERDGAAISAEQARNVVRQVSLAPPEGELQVFVLDEFHLVRDAAPILLKSIEEPPPTAVFIVLAESVPDELRTIASRCVQLRTSAVPRAAVQERLVADGADPERAAVAAASCGGSLRRARLLVADPGLVERREAWYRAPERLDGTGHAALTVADELLEDIESVLVPLHEQHEAELAAFDESVEQTGVARKGDRARLEARQKREARRIRTGELLAGLATLVGRYRDDIAGAVDTAGAAAAFLDAAAAVQRVADALQFNPNEGLQLRSLLWQLPPLTR